MTGSLTFDLKTDDLNHWANDSGRWQYAHASGQSIAMQPSKKILFAPASNVLGHVGRCLELARELKRRGHHVIFVGTPRYLQDSAIVRVDEFEFYELPDFDTDEAMEILRYISKAPSKRFIRAMVDEELKSLKTLAPDLIIIDFRLTMYTAARVQGIPIVSLLLSLWMQNYTTIKPRMVRTYRQSRLFRRLLGEKATALLTPFLLHLIIRYKMRPFRQVARCYGQTFGPMLWDILVGDYNLLLDTEAWSPTRPLPATFERVGPIVWEPELPIPGWVGRLDLNRTILFINFGSTAHRDLFRRMFADFADTRYQVIVATGGQIDPQEFDIPSNFYVEKFLPSSKIMEYVDLVIYHGGAGTAYQVMKAGVPSIVAATHMDQEYQGLATEAHRVGLFFTMHEVLADPGLILTATDQVVADLAVYRANTRKLQADLLRHNGPVAAADGLERFMRERRL